MREMEKIPAMLECHHIAGDDCTSSRSWRPHLEGVQEILRDLRGPIADEHAHDDRVVHVVRKSGLHSYGARLHGGGAQRQRRHCLSDRLRLLGSTYLAIRSCHGAAAVSVRGLRFLVAGLILLAVARALGDPLPRKSDWRTLAIVGLLLLAGRENAFVVWSEQYVGSGIASIFVVTVAMWTALFDAIIPGGSERAEWRVVAGLLLGFLGTLLLVGRHPRRNSRGG